MVGPEGGGGGGSFGTTVGGMEVVEEGVAGVGAGTGGIMVVAGPVGLTTPCSGVSGLNFGSELSIESARSAYPRICSAINF